MELNTDDENSKCICYDLYIFDEDRIVKTIENILLLNENNYRYIDYGKDYDYDFMYKNISTNIRFRYNCSDNGIWWRSENAQDMTIQYDKTKINKEDFDSELLLDKFKADNKTYGESIMRKEDPKELFIAVNEFVYNISKNIHNCIDACYWMEWILEYECICIKNKTKLKCERRTQIPVESKEQLSIIAGSA